MSEALKETLLRSDFDRVRQHPKYKSANVQTKHGSIFQWTLNIPGGKGTSWQGLVYDLDITFSRRHPFEPPRVDFPRTHRNISNPGHPLVDGSGRLRTQKLSFDKWLPTIAASEVVGWLYHLFETEPPCVTSGDTCPFTHLSSETVLQVHTFLDAGDLGRLSQTGKQMLSLCFDEATWAKLYYRSCTSLDGLLGEKEGGACPVRVMGVSGKWFWEGSREAFIRSWEMRNACSQLAFATAKTQKLHVSWELGGLLIVAAGLLSDIKNRRLTNAPGGGNVPNLAHMEHILDSQTMRIASAQRLMAWPGVCRELLAEKEQDSSLPIGLWDQPGHRPFSTPAPSSSESNSPSAPGAASGATDAGAAGSGTPPFSKPRGAADGHEAPAAARASFRRGRSGPAGGSRTLVGLPAPPPRGRGAARPVRLAHHGTPRTRELILVCGSLWVSPRWARGRRHPRERAAGVLVRRAVLADPVRPDAGQEAAARAPAQLLPEVLPRAEAGREGQGRGVDGRGGDHSAGGREHGGTFGRVG
ncbi:unnamed protein product [Scytosiphon promiscuus]